VRDIKIVPIDICVVFKLVLLCTAPPFTPAEKACVFKDHKALGKMHVRHGSLVVLQLEIEFLNKLFTAL